ncbi:MAG: hypothetical protein O2894_11505, partial [Planctomycetota bacterium]|nr:hypothetical protein [Planctomycetota bacterium]
MKAHAIRRGLWLANLALGAAFVGVLAWYVMQVRPAAAAVADRPQNDRPADLEALRADYEKARLTGLKWKPDVPVEDKELDAVILRADYKQKSPTYWIFSGGLPPEAVKGDKPVETGPPPPTGLATLGKVLSVMSAPSPTVLFKFGGNKTRAFGVGDFMRASEKDPGRFKLIGISEPKPRVYEINYEVYGQDATKPERTDKLVYDRSGGGDFPSWLRPVDAPAAAPGAVPPAAPDAASGATGPDSAAVPVEAGAAPGTT